jgi:hypothetical protein
MPNTSNEDLGETETQMRRALGLNDQRLTLGHEPLPSAPTGNSAAHPHRRRFVRDGDVPVTVVHREHDHGVGTNRLDAAQQTLSEQIAAREQAEQLLQEARATRRALETNLAHERIAKEEAVRRSEDERQAIQDELATERAGRQQAEQQRDEAVVRRQKAEERLRRVTGVQEAQTASVDPVTAKRGRSAGQAGVVRSVDGPNVALDILAPTGTVDGTPTVGVARKRGRPPKVGQPEPEFVEWWKPGWRERY